MSQAHQRIVVLLVLYLLLVESYIDIHRENTGTHANADINRQRILQCLGTLGVDELLVGKGRIVVNEIRGIVLLFHIMQLAHVKHFHIGADTI